MEKINIKYLGHACFKLDFDGYALVIDPYRDNIVPGLNLGHITANSVICSHEHNDHGGTEKIMIMPTELTSPKIETIKTYHDPEQGALRGENLIHIITHGGLKIAHLGDLGHIPTEEQMKELMDLDLMLIPIGGHYTIDYKEARHIATTTNAKVVVPMHYKTDTTGYEVIDTIDNYLYLVEEAGEKLVYTEVDSYTLDKNSEKSTVVINFKG